MLSIQEIVEQAHALAERRVDQSKLDLRLELFLGIQDMLHENRFWWAEKSAAFTTSTGVAAYDLSSATIADVKDVDEIVVVYNVQDSSNPTELLPILDRPSQLAALEAIVAAPPASWMITPGSWPTLRLGSPADGAYRLRFLYNASVDTSLSTGDVVPLVPHTLHYGLVIILKRRIFNFLYGQNDPRFVVANAEYERFIKNASRRASFSAQHMREFGTDVDAIQAHN